MKEAITLPPTQFDGVPVLRFRFRGCLVLLSNEFGKWHMSISRANRYPDWDDIRDARYELIPDNVTMAMLLPPRSEYVNVHPNCFHLYQVEEQVDESILILPRQ